MKNMPGANPSRRWDQIGVWASAACSVHCLATPLLFLAMPTFAGVWAHPGAHLSMALLVVPLAAKTLIGGYRVHRRQWVAGTALGGIALILVGCLLPFIEGEPVLGHATSEVAEECNAGGDSAEESPAAGSEACCSHCCPQIVEDPAGGWRLQLPLASLVTIAGSLLLVTGHIGNLVCRRCCGP